MAGRFIDVSTGEKYDRARSPEGEGLGQTVEQKRLLSGGFLHPKGKRKFAFTDGIYYLCIPENGGERPHDMAR